MNKPHIYRTMLVRGASVVGSALLASMLFSCAPKKSAHSPEQSPRSEANSDKHVEAEMSEDEAELMKQIEAEAALADAESNESSTPPEDAPREVVYRVSSDSLKIQVEGAEFHPEAELIRIGGGYGVKIVVEASSSAPLVLLAPKGGPLAFSGSVRGSTTRKFGDTRDGEDELALEPGAPLTFERTWPAPGQPALAQGQQLELQVGLWGLGKDTESRRPLRKFFTVKLRGEAKGRVVIEAPR